MLTQQLMLPTTHVGINWRTPPCSWFKPMQLLTIAWKTPSLISLGLQAETKQVKQKQNKKKDRKQLPEGKKAIFMQLVCAWFDLNFQ